MPYTIHKQIQAEYQKQLNTGITPMLEKAQVFPINNSDSTPLKIAKPKAESKKRSASTEDDEKFKRTKSVSEESGPKIFDDVKWE